MENHCTKFWGALLGGSGVATYDTVRNYWKAQKVPGDFETFWRAALHDGIVAGTTFSPKAVKLKTSGSTDWLGGSTSVSDTQGPKAETQNAQSKTGTLEISFQPDPTLFDGRFANNGWLQELPKP